MWGIPRWTLGVPLNRTPNSVVMFCQGEVGWGQAFCPPFHSARSFDEFLHRLTGAFLHNSPNLPYPTYHMFRVGLVLRIPKGLILEPWFITTFFERSERSISLVFQIVVQIPPHQVFGSPRYNHIPPPTTSVPRPVSTSSESLGRALLPACEFTGDGNATCYKVGPYQF